MSRGAKLVATALLALALSLGAVALGALKPRPTQPSPPVAVADTLRGRAASAIRVIDGDTVEDTEAAITYRVVNIDTPETGDRAACQAERLLGAQATAAARALIAAAETIDLRTVGRTDRYGRTIAYIVIDGRDFGETLIREGLARPWRGRREPWCGANGELLP